MQLLLEAALPPVIPADKPGGELRYDFQDPAYQARKEQARIEARSLALWLAYPVFKKQALREQQESLAQSPLKVPETVAEITNFMQQR